MKNRYFDNLSNIRNTYIFKWLDSCPKSIPEYFFKNIFLKNIRIKIFR